MYRIDFGTPILLLLILVGCGISSPPTPTPEPFPTLIVSVHSLLLKDIEIEGGIKAISSAGWNDVMELIDATFPKVWLTDEFTRYKFQIVVSQDEIEECRYIGASASGSIIRIAIKIKIRLTDLDFDQIIDEREFEGLPPAEKCPSTIETTRKTHDSFLYGMPSRTSVSAWLSTLPDKTELPDLE